MIRYFIFERTVMGIDALASIWASRADAGHVRFPVVVPVIRQGFNPVGSPEAFIRNSLVSLP
jgi:hypothetical protein